MTDHDPDPSVHANPPSVQVYFQSAFAQDSQFPLDPGDDCVAWLEGGSVVICPYDRLDEVPDALDGPPTEAVPAAYQDAIADGPEFDPDLISDTSSGEVDTETDTTTAASGSSHPARSEIPLDATDADNPPTDP